ncbi:MAG TPA: Crp/Fnr family transcriptional regulator [Bacteroidales bacterium]
MLSELLKNNKTILRGINSYMLPHLEKIIDLTAQLEKTAGDNYTNAFDRQKLPKGTYLLKAGNVSRHIWILEEGSARTFECNDAQEVTMHFFFPSEVIDSFCSSAFRKPSEVNIQLLDDSVVYSISKPRLERLKTDYPVLAEIEKLLFECHANWVEKTFYNARFLTAQERYQYLMATQPYLVRHIPVNILATYLGVSRETLSRNRNSGMERA